MAGVRSVRHRLRVAALGAALVLVAAAAAAQTHADHVRVEPTIPADEFGGAFDNGLQNAAVFAWNEFIALNWPATAGTRDTADAAQPFGTQSGPLVWETFRSKVEVYPGNGNAARPPHGGASDYNDPPDYIYDPGAVHTSDGRIPACAGEPPSAPTAWINLDETSELGVNQTFAGIVPATDPSGKNSAPRLIRYAVKTDHVEYDYVVSAQTPYWYGASLQSSPLATAIANYQSVAGKTPPVDPPAPFVDLPVGTIEVKSAWRPLAPGENPRRFHTALVRYYEAGPTPGSFCYRQAVWGMVGMHIIHKTQSAPWFIWATFEQADNLRSAGGRTVEDDDGALRITTPELLYKDAASGPSLSIVGRYYCTAPGPRLYFRESKQYSGLPSGGDICVDQRFNPIPATVIAINAEAHRAIDAYAAQHRVADSPWRYYKLVGVQPQPFDKSEITPGTGSNSSPGTFYTADAVIETDFSLGHFSGRIAANGVPTDYGPGGTPDFKNTLLAPFQGGGARIPPVNMGGCSGCHAGSAAAGGTDFSFILGASVIAPETPATGMAQALPRLQHLRTLLLRH
jgi:hypothetical protein